MIDESKAFAELMALPLDNPERPKLSDRVPIKPERLHARCRKFLTLGAVYSERETWCRRQLEAEPPYPQRLRAVCPVKPTRQAPPLPFESGKNCLPGMELWAKAAR